jgi:hypothetical protein
MASIFDPSYYDPQSYLGLNSTSYSPNSGVGMIDLSNSTPQWWQSPTYFDPSYGTSYPAAGDTWSNTQNSNYTWSPTGDASVTGPTGGNWWDNIANAAVSSLTSPAGLTTIAGGLLGSLDGSKQTGTETKTQAPWTPQQPYLLDMFNKAKAASDSGAASPYETSALQGMQGFANGPKTNPLAGVDNPYLTQTINNASQDAMRNLMPMYDQAQRASGSFGNSGVTEAFGRTAADTLGKIATSARMQDYGTQQQLGENAVNRTVSSLGPLFSAGQNSASNPWTNINKYGSAITGNYGGTSSQPIYTNPMSNMLGGGLLGSQVYRNLMMPQQGSN